MRNGKYASRNSKKVVVTLLALVLVLGCAIGGTIAWLTDSTDAVVNTFAPTDIEITLIEHKYDTTDVSKVTNEELNGNVYPMVPGVTYGKDPVVAVDGTQTDVDCYLFVRFLEENGAQTYLEYTSLLNEDSGWKQVDGTTDVWYRIVKTDDANKEWHLLENDKITVKGDAVTKDNMDTASKAKLTYEAYAIQYVGFESDVAGAWAAAYAQKTA